LRWPLLVALSLAVQNVTAPAKTPVVVELYTSEGCSSCPPADAVLSELVKEGSVGAAQVIPLGLHVTYWDQLGWRDSASLQGATDRQQEYGRVFGADSMYTPQAVIDGRTQLVGSDENGLRRAIAKAAAQPHVPVQLSASIQADGTVTARVTVENVPVEQHEAFHRVTFITEDGLTSIVKRGENGGRTLNNDAVVRRISTSDGVGRIAPEWHRDRLHLTVIVQGEKTRRIYGAATVPLR